MTDQATQQTTIKASPAECYRVAVDFERYPAWARDLREATVVDHDDDGRPLDVEFRAAALGRSIRYRLRYDYSEAPERLRWHLVDGDLRRLDGCYEFVPSGVGTAVTYTLAVDLKFPIPSIIKTRAEKLVMHAALNSLKREIERSTSEA